MSYHHQSPRAESLNPVMSSPLKETTLVLLDAYHNPQLVEETRRIVESNEEAKVMDVLLRASGPFVQPEIHIEADSTVTVGRPDRIKSSTENTVKERFTCIQRVVVTARASQR
jgi:divalent metal cation (Fe/Co/Zn/Cd) transporter